MNKANPVMTFLQFASLTLALFPFPSIALGAGPHHMSPRVPLDQIEQAHALTNPLDLSSAVVEAGKMLYEGGKAPV